MTRLKQADRFPTGAILVPPVGTLLCVFAVRLLVGSAGATVALSGVAAVVVLAMVAFLYLSVLIELVALPIGVVKLWRNPDSRTAKNVLVVLLGSLHIAIFVFWLVSPKSFSP